MIRKIQSTYFQLLSGGIPLVVGKKSEKYFVAVFMLLNKSINKLLMKSLLSKYGHSILTSSFA